MLLRAKIVCTESSRSDEPSDGAATPEPVVRHLEVTSELFFAGVAMLDELTPPGSRRAYIITGPS
ncbi:hypothetical protein ACFP8W_00200 [Nocardioides hankookensis]|uniref:Uncharacterized protein n=1 Tax=Nocardioides hankookensis TaxID=443157 RepID=A0ABW1LP40_9ACTN